LRRRVPLRGYQDGTGNDLMAVDRRQRDLGDDPIKVALFIPCYVDAVFPEVGVATLELLERLGVEVVYPLGQTCCGLVLRVVSFSLPRLTVKHTENYRV